MDVKKISALEQHYFKKWYFRDPHKTTTWLHKKSTKEEPWKRCTSFYLNHAPLVLDM